MLTLRSLLLVTILAAIAFPSPADAQTEDPVAERLGLTPDEGSLPIWARPDAQDVGRLGEIARTMRQGVLLVGTAADGHGTAFVISRQRRLLVTNAHVADIFQKTGKMLAVLNEGTAVYEVEHVWYHPGVLRVLDDRTFAIGRSTDIRDGDVYPRSPDIALLQLKEGGAELPMEFTLATSDAMSDAFARTVAILGFPGHDTKGWPGLGERPQATFHDGVVSRVTDFHLSNAKDSQARQFLQHTAIGLGGFSGSPLFLPSGAVVGVHNAFRPVSDRGAQAVMSHAVRIDCLWELIVANDLLDLFPIPVDPASLNVARFAAPDPMIENYRRARELAKDAERLNHLHQFVEAADVSAKALELVPNYPEALYQKGAAHSGYLATYGLRITRKVRDEQQASAEYYSRRLLQVAPSDATSMLSSLLNMFNAAVHQSNDGKKTLAKLNHKLVYAAANKLIESGKIRDDKTLAFAYHVRACALSGIQFVDGDTDR
ncbi:MAG: trypsin-like peptidase domain-containing protein, partial [Planctomycetales bacterium]|nr:trypsin-like peptidase domain-containing protein [Planctomycetales bacterium]